MRTGPAAAPARFLTSVPLSKNKRSGSASPVAFFGDFFSLVKKIKPRFLIVYGPTEEPLDSVRYISNSSTGTMGRSLVAAVKKRGCGVKIVECPKDARTARDLQKILIRFLSGCDVLIMAAAVCDARPKYFSRHKIKKENLHAIPLVKNPDILGSLKKKKKKHQVFIGFGLESSRILKNGFKKVVSKGLDLIVLQKVTNNSTPFGEKPVSGLFLDHEKKSRKFHSISKNKLSKILVHEAEKIYRAKLGSQSQK